MSNYNYNNFSTKHFDLLDFRGPEVGQKAPDGSVLKTDGTHTSFLDFDARFLFVRLSAAGFFDSETRWERVDLGFPKKSSHADLDEFYCAQYQGSSQQTKQYRG